MANILYKLIQSSGCGVGEFMPPEVRWERGLTLVRYGATPRKVLDITWFRQWLGHRTFAMNFISISWVGSASRGVTKIVLATAGFFDPYASFRTEPATANAVSMSVT